MDLERWWLIVSSSFLISIKLVVNKLGFNYWQNYWRNTKEVLETLKKGGRHIKCEEWVNIQANSKV